MLVQNGTLHVGDDFICGMFSGRVRALLDERGKPVKEAGPGDPGAGARLRRRADGRRPVRRRGGRDRGARDRAAAPAARPRGEEPPHVAAAVVTLEDFMSQTRQARRAHAPLVIKADQGGPAEALADALGQLSNAARCGSRSCTAASARSPRATSCSPRRRARSSSASTCGPDNNARAAAEREGVDIKLYRIIYEAVDDVRAALEGLLARRSARSCSARPRCASCSRCRKIGTIAGCSVRSGVIIRAGQGARHPRRRRGLRRHDRLAAPLQGRRARKSAKGFECGIGIENFNDLKVGDVHRVLPHGRGRAHARSRRSSRR